MGETSATSSFFGDEVTIQFSAPLRTAEVASLVDELGASFFQVRAERQPSPPWATPLLEYAAFALGFASGAVAKGFLEELGKDSWRRVRDELYRLYRTAKKGAYYPSFHAFALDTTVDGVPVTFRIQKDHLMQDQFEAALAAAQAAIALDMVGLEREPWVSGGWRYILSWDEALSRWVPMRVLESQGMAPSP